jgi:hypothetical protein
MARLTVGQLDLHPVRLNATRFNKTLQDLDADLAVFDYLGEEMPLEHV